VSGGAIFHNALDAVEVGRDWYEKLKQHARETPNRQARLCLHRSPDELLQQMVIVFHRDAVIPPHRHRNKVESYHLIFGDLDIVLFNDDGRPTQLVRMGDFAGGKTHIYRQELPVWHSVVVGSEYAAIHEITNGPFRAEERELAPWAPADRVELGSFLARSVATLRRRGPGDLG
jgi:cupin fold WbuC family metalloprotein